MHIKLKDWLSRNGISLHSGCRFLHERGVPIEQIYGPNSDIEFDAAAAKIESEINQSPRVVLVYSHRPLWVPVPALWSEMVFTGERKGFNNVHHALRT